MNKPKLKLTGTNGNAFSVIALCVQEAKKNNFSKEEISKMRAEMMSGDYDNLLQTVMKYFDAPRENSKRIVGHNWWFNYY